MKKIRISQVRFRALLGVPILFLLFLPDAGRAATTGITAVLQQLGSGAPTSYGDYVSSAQAGGMNTFHQYYLEVPPGLSHLRVRLFDADIGRGTTNRFDWQAGGGGASWNTSCRYTLYNPSGTSVATFTGNATTGTNNGWDVLYNTTTTPIPAGHWRLVVDTSSAVTTGDDCNGYGFSADDGDETSGGTEINIYGYTFVPVGERTYGGVNTITTTLYPYVTSGCVVDWNDWDGDNPTPGVCTITYASRTRTFSGSYGGSGSTVWQNRPITGYESNSMASDTGVWRATLAYTETSSGGSNYGIFYVGDFNAASPPPTSQPQANTQRIYLPTDGMGAPPKPFLTQNLSYISGPNPPTVGATTRVRVEVTIFNPTPRSIASRASARSPPTCRAEGSSMPNIGLHPRDRSSASRPWAAPATSFGTRGRSAALTRTPRCPMPSTSRRLTAASAFPSPGCPPQTAPGPVSPTKRAPPPSTTDRSASWPRPKGPGAMFRPGSP